MSDSLKVQLDFQQKTSLTEQIRREIYQLIEQKQLPPGSLLPTVRQLAAQLGVNFNTVARAYRALDMAGIITTRQGRGTYVSEAPAVHPQEQTEKSTSVKEQIEQLLRSAEQDGISRQQIAQVLLAASHREHRHEKIQVRYRISRKKKESAKSQAAAEPHRTPLPRIKNVRVSKRRVHKHVLFHVKQTRGKPGI